MASRKVQAYVYDLTQGMARQFSPMLLGQTIEGVWHTGLVVDGTEYFFGHGISRCRAGSTPFGFPTKVLDLGTTEVPPDMVEQLVADVQPRYGPDDYDLLFHNCNHFTNELGLLLTGEGLPESIMAQAQQVLDTPLGQMFMPMIMQMEGVTGRATATGFNGSSGQASSSSSAPGAGAAAPARGGSNSSSTSAVPAAEAAPAAVAAGAAAQARAMAAASASPAASGVPDPPAAMFLAAASGQAAGTPVPSSSRAAAAGEAAQDSSVSPPADAGLGSAAGISSEVAALQLEDAAGSKTAGDTGVVQVTADSSSVGS